MPHRFIQSACLVVLLAALGGASLLDAQSRFALVVGNGTYKNLPRRATALADASALARALRETGFAVDLLQNASLAEMRKAVANLQRQAGRDPESTLCLYYAGHAVQSGGVNYLLGVDADIPGAGGLAAAALSLSDLLEGLSRSGGGLKLLLLDACAANPFAWGRAAPAGLAQVANQPPGSLLAYATSPDLAAPAASGPNGLFATSLIRNLLMPGLEVHEVLNRAGGEVMAASGNRQIPAIFNHFSGTSYLAAIPRPAVVAPSVPGSQAAATIYRSDPGAADARWVFRDDDQVFFAAQPPGLVLGLNFRGWWNASLPMAIGHAGDFAVAAEFRRVRDSSGSGWGLEWGRRDDDGLFYFLVHDDGSYSYGKRAGGQWRDLRLWPAIAGNDIDRPLRLELRKLGSGLQFYANGSWVGQADFEPFFGDGVGFLLVGETKVTITGFEVRRL